MGAPIAAEVVGELAEKLKLLTDPANVKPSDLAAIQSALKLPGDTLGVLNTLNPTSYSSTTISSADPAILVLDGSDLKRIPIVMPGSTIGWSPTLMTGLIAWVDPTIPSTVTGVATVSKVATVKSGLRDLKQPEPVQKPALTSGRLVFDGSNDHLLSANPYTKLSSVTLADISSSEVGKGPTCTGLARAPDGTWWIGNYGKKNATTDSGETFDAGVVQYSSDFQTVLRVVRLSNLGLTQGSVQGVAYDTSDDTIWFNNLDTNTIVHISASGTLLGTVSTSGNVNGLAYDASLNCLIGLTPSGTATWLNKTTGATIKSFSTVSANTDHLTFNPADGTEGSLYITRGSSGNPGILTKYDVATASAVKQWILDESLAIEGIAIDFTTGKIWVADDAYYHNCVPNLNRIATFQLDSLVSPNIGTRLTIGFVSKIAATPSGSVAVISGGDVANGRGFALYHTSVANQMRLSIKLGTAAATQVNWTVPNASVETVYFLDIDTASGTALLYANGAKVGGTATIPTGTIPALTWVVAGAVEGTSVTRTSAITLGPVVVTTSLDQQRLESHLAWQTGNQSLLISTNPYRNARP